MFFVLDLPWGERTPKVKYRPDKKVHVYEGTILPQKLKPYRCDDFSYGRWQEDEMNRVIQYPIQSDTQFTLKDHQKEAAKKILNAYDSGWPGFLEADKTGLGKTLSVLAGITLIARKQGYSRKRPAKVLIVCPLSVIPQWRMTIRNYSGSLNYIRPLIINYQQLSKLQETPPNASVVKKRKTKKRITAKNGQPTIDWDFVVFDESHKLKNYPSSAVSHSSEKIAQLGKKYIKGRSPFVIFSTATPGSSPLHFSLLSGILSKLINPNLNEYITPKKWGQFLADNNFHVTKNKNGWAWAQFINFDKNSSNPIKRQKYEQQLNESILKQRKDARRIGLALKERTAPFIMRKPTDIAGWPEQQIITIPTVLDHKGLAKYKMIWNEFRSWLRMNPTANDSQSAFTERLRYRQKSSLLKVDPMVIFVDQLVEAGYQVYISCAFIETVDLYKTKLSAKNIKVSEVSGRITNNGSEQLRKQEILKFQKGITNVIISTVTEGVSFHANEILEDGTKATSNDRVTIIHDLRENDLDNEQALGRAHRDGQNSIAYIPYIENTIDEKVIKSFSNKTANRETMLGEGSDYAERINRIFVNEAARSQNI